jgi:hypothetical protein
MGGVVSDDYCQVTCMRRGTLYQCDRRAGHNGDHVADRHDGTTMSWRVTFIEDADE